VTHGNDVTPADEDLGFAECDVTLDEKCGPQRQEGGFPIGFKFGPLVRMQRVFDGEFVQAELGLKQAQVILIGCFDADPDEMVGPGRPLAALVDLDIGYLAAIAVSSRGDHLAHRTSFAMDGLLEYRCQ
jgi:hypothetical protein